MSKPADSDHFHILAPKCVGQEIRWGSYWGFSFSAFWEAVTIPIPKMYVTFWVNQVGKYFDLDHCVSYGVWILNIFYYSQTRQNIMHFLSMTLAKINIWSALWPLIWSDLYKYFSINWTIRILEYEIHCLPLVNGHVWLLFQNSKFYVKMRVLLSRW